MPSRRVRTPPVAGGTAGGAAGTGIVGPPDFLRLLEHDDTVAEHIRCIELVTGVRASIVNTKWVCMRGDPQCWAVVDYHYAGGRTYCPHCGSRWKHMQSRVIYEVNNQYNIMVSVHHQRYPGFWVLPVAVSDLGDRLPEELREAALAF